METDLVTIWRKLYFTLQGSNEQPLEEDISGLTYKAGGVIGIENGKLCWLDRWAIAFPTLSIFT